MVFDGRLRLDSRYVKILANRPSGGAPVQADLRSLRQVRMVPAAHYVEKEGRVRNHREQDEMPELQATRPEVLLLAAEEITAQYADHS